MNTYTDSLIVETPLAPAGMQVGQSAADKVGFYGVTPIVQPSGADQVALTAAAGTKIGTGILADSGGAYNQTTTNNNNATIAAAVFEIRRALVAAGLIKGSA
jgi:hypothetical protein